MDAAIAAGVAGDRRAAVVRAALALALTATVAVKEPEARSFKVCSRRHPHRTTLSSCSQAVEAQAATPQAVGVSSQAWHSS